MSEISKQALLVDNSQSFPNNNAGAITPSDLRAFNVNMIDSLVDEIGYNQDSASWNNSISNLNGFTSSQQPTFNALNSFTASQLNINTGVNTFTQSANGRLNVLEVDTANLEAFTSSINQIIVNGVSIGTSTRLFFNGFVSASIVPNVDGDIASITVLSDPSLTPTASFNQYTASTNQELNTFSSSQNSFNQSATASIQQLLGFSASLDATYATDAQLNFSSSVLQANIDTKLNTASFNSFTQSQQLLNGTYATTGSNSFVGNQNITGSLYISSSTQRDVIIEGQLWVSSSNMFASGSTVQPQINLSGPLGGTAGGSRSGSVSITPGQVLFNRGTRTAAIGNTVINVSDTSIGTAGQSAAIYPTGIDNGTLDGNEIGLTINGGILGVTNFSGPSIWIADNTLAYKAMFGFQDTTNYTDGRITAFTPLVASNSLIITGSVYGNVSASSITAQTASIDLSVANYFTLTLSGSTNINVLNPKPGVTATLVINTSTSPSASFSSNVKQPSGSLYVASPSGNIDIISFTAVDSNTVYAFPAQSFV